MGCGSEETAAPAPTPAVDPATPATPAVPAVPAAPAVPVAPAGPAPLVLGGPAQPLNVPLPPHFALTIPAAGEYQIDAMGSPMDAQLYIYRGDQRVARDSDGGDRTNARVIKFLQPGLYSVRAYEYRGRPMAGQIQAQLLTPLTPVGAITPGQNVVVQVPSGTHPRQASAEVTLTVTVPGMHQIDITSDAEHDSQVRLIHNNMLLEENSDGGDGRNARIRRQLAAGTYTIRVYDWRRRATSLTVTVAHDPTVGATTPPTPPMLPPGTPIPGAIPLALGVPAAPFQVPASPSFNLTLPAAGEYQIDAMGRPMDAQLYVYQADQRVATDSDSGDSTDARIIKFIPAGTYSVRVMEYRARPMNARVQAQLLPPMTPVGAIAPGQNLPVPVPQGTHPRAASREVTLTIAAPGNYQLDAIGADDFDPQMILIQNNAIVEQNSDGGDGRNARITRQLVPGTYTIRVYDWRRRAGTINVTVAAAP